MVLQVDEAHVEARFGPFGHSVYVECTIGSEIILDTPDGTSR
jgi:hypothetical protein